MPHMEDYTRAGSPPRWVAVLGKNTSQGALSSKQRSKVRNKKSFFLQTVQLPAGRVREECLLRIRWFSGGILLSAATSLAKDPSRFGHVDFKKTGSICHELLRTRLIMIIILLASSTPMQMELKGDCFGVAGLSVTDAMAASGSSGAGDATARYMKRFNVPQQNVDFVWLKSGGVSTQRGTKTHHWTVRRKNVGVYAGYAPIYDRSARRYCERTAAILDTQQTVGHALMASGACPNWGKIIAFTDASGRSSDLNRWNNEIHGRVMPHSTLGCQRHAQPGSSEVQKENEGMAMYSGYMTSCPFNQGVYTEDMLGDDEYDPLLCDFVTDTRKLWFLDTGRPSGGKQFTPYAFHGAGGHLGYDYEGQTKHVGCPPYAPPRKTSAMKDSSWLRGPFECSLLSRCTTHCWPYADGSLCFRSLPAIFNDKTKECRLLGYHTQYFQKHSCASLSTSVENKFYCVKPVKTAETSAQVYLSSHTRPDYENECPPRQPLLHVRWGRRADSYCNPLPEARVIDKTSAEGCGQAAFEHSSSDDESLKLEGLHWTTFSSADCPRMEASCRERAKGRCALYEQVPNCFVRESGSISFTSLSAVDPSIARPPDAIAVLPPDPCLEVNCGKHGSCTKGKCVCEAGWEGGACDKFDRCFGVNCQNGGQCHDGRCACPLCYQGDLCERKKEDCCFRTEGDCGANEECDIAIHKCVCKAGHSGDNCTLDVPLCPEGSCNGHGQCEQGTGRCVCDMCHEGLQCEVTIPNCCQSSPDCKNPRKVCDLAQHLCVCLPAYEGPNCGSMKDERCQEWCAEPGHVTRDALSCSGVDCASSCCKAISTCDTNDKTEECYQQRMQELNAECCLAKSEKGNTAVYAAAAGAVALLVLLIGAGAAVVIGRKKSPQAQTTAEFVEFDASGDGREEEGQPEEAIEVNLEDFRQAPDDKVDVAKKAISTTWDT